MFLLLVAVSVGHGIEQAPNVLERLLIGNGNAYRDMIFLPPIYVVSGLPIQLLS